MKTEKISASAAQFNIKHCVVGLYMNILSSVHQMYFCSERNYDYKKIQVHFG